MKDERHQDDEKSLSRKELLPANIDTSVERSKQDRNSQEPLQPPDRNESTF